MDRKLKTVVNATLALMMTSTSVYAGSAPVKPAQARGNVILAQANCDPATDPNCAAAAPEAPAEEPQPRRQRREQPAEEAAPQPETEPAPRRQQRQAEPEAPAAGEAPTAEEPAPRRQRREQPAAEPETPAVEEPAAEVPAPRRQRREQPAAEQAPAAEEPQAPATEEPAQPRRQRREKPAREQQSETPAQEQPAQPSEQPAQPPQAPAAEEPQAPAAEQPAQRPRRERPDSPAEQAPVEPAAPSDEQLPAPSGEQPPAEQPSTQPTDGQAPAPASEQPAPAEVAPNDGATAPLFDSQKRPPRRQGRNEAPVDGGQAPAQGGQQTAQPPAEPTGPPPADDRAAQEAAQPVEIVPVTRERGTRREGRPDQRQRFERPQGADVIRELGDRIILQFNNQTFVESNEAPRMSRGARDVYYEDLPRGRTRETIVRENGVQVVTIRNQYGDVVRRSRITPDGREYVLTYVDDEDFERGGRAWRDPGDDLPPMNVDIDYDDYIFEAERARDVDDYYDFLREPPVEKVQRLYSVDEVKRSARVRDIARRIDLDTIKFAFGKAEVPESEISRLDGVAQAMEKLLKANPAETFLIEGHTDAVGTDVANLALSDRRAEAVADALTNVFGIPPENLSTQGYGEQYLKVRTQEPNQENRRVAIRRITALVAPMASAN